MRVDEGSKERRSLVAMKTKARTAVVGNGEKSLLGGDPGSELCLGRRTRKKKCEDD